MIGRGEKSEQLCHCWHGAVCCSMSNKSWISLLFPSAFLLLWKGTQTSLFIVGNTVCRFPETLSQSKLQVRKSLCLCMCVSVCDGNVNSNRKWPVSHALTPALSPSCWSVRTHKQAHTDVRTDTHTAGLPVSGDLGWASEAPHGFHIHSSPPPLPSELAPSSSFSFILSPPSHLFFFFHISYSFLSLSPQPQSDERIEPQPVGVSSFHLSRPFRDSDVKSAGSQHKRMRFIQVVWIGTQSWSTVVLSWLEPQHIWTKLRPVKEKLVRGASASPTQIARDLSSSHRNIFTRTLIRDRTCFRVLLGLRLKRRL